MPGTYTIYPANGLSEPVTLQQVLTSNVASPGDALVLNIGSKINLGGFRLWLAGSTVTTDGNFTVGGNNVTAGALVGSNTAGPLNVVGSQADGATATGVVLNTPNYATAGAKIASFQNGGVEKASLDRNGGFTSQVATGNDAVTLQTGARINLGGGFRIWTDGTNIQLGNGFVAGASSSINGILYVNSGSIVNGNLGNLTLTGNPPDGAASVGLTLNAATNLVTAGSKVTNLKNGPNEVASVDKDGQYTGALKPYGFTVQPLATPVNAAFTQGTGTLAAGTYYYRVSATNSVGETLASTETSLTIAANTGVNVNWGYVQGATGYKVYGRTTGAEQLLATISNGQTLTYLDNGSVTPSGAMQGGNTTGAVNITTPQGYAGLTVGTLYLQNGVYLSSTGANGGSVNLGGSSIAMGYTDASGTPGAATINNPSGRAAIALGASSVVVTCANVAATSKVMVQLETVGAGVGSLVVVPAAGSFTVTSVNATGAATVTTAAAKFSFTVTN